MPLYLALTRILTLTDKLIGKAEIYVLGWGIIIMAVNTIANVFGRYLFSQSIYFTEELNEFLIVIITFMGLGYVTRKGRHIRMSALYDLLSTRYKKLLMIIIASLTAVAMFTLAWYAFEYVAKLASRGRVTPALQFPLYLTYIWVVLGFAVTGIQYVLTAFRNLNLSEEDVYISFSTVDEYLDPEIAEVLHLYQQDHDIDSTEQEQSAKITSTQSVYKENKS
ncbi:TRAP transporter small permease [Oceanisphaera sp. IT1-181]|uniref:TRAP transporter small permease n=1 Tax=Oceanisphaera sp. IT1-181 TaxID=3081199 RepID=UPI0029CAA3C7|nr:TRAP transporter small permease [Oceanisphaera sp. IT1-181]